MICSSTFLTLTHLKTNNKRLCFTCYMLYLKKATQCSQSLEDMELTVFACLFLIIVPLILNCPHPVKLRDSKAPTFVNVVKGNLLPIFKRPET